jgi:hypothetical protein
MRDDARRMALAQPKSMAASSIYLQRFQLFLAFGHMVNCHITKISMAYIKDTTGLVHIDTIILGDAMGIGI